MADVKVVAPMNMGERLDWDAQTKKYDVNVDDLLAEIKKLKENQYVDTTPSIDTPNTYFNLDTDLTGLGMKVFYGNIEVNHENTPTSPIIQHGTGKALPYPCFVKGMPAKAINTVEQGGTSESAYSEDQFDGWQSYDFTGYQFATPVEVVQVIYHMSQTFVRTNDAGMRLDGSLVNPDAWLNWRKS